VVFLEFTNLSLSKRILISFNSSWLNSPVFFISSNVAHELTHHFIDEYQEEVIAGLPQVITQRNTTNFSLGDFISQHEEEIAIELPQIIIRKNLASFALASTKSYQK